MSQGDEFFCSFFSKSVYVEPRVTIFFFYDNVVFASFLVNTDSETAVVNVTYATREEAKTWVDLGLFLFKCFRTVVFEFYRVLYLYICFFLKKKSRSLTRQWNSRAFILRCLLLVVQRLYAEKCWAMASELRWELCLDSDQE